MLFYGVANRDPRQFYDPEALRRPAGSRTRTSASAPWARTSAWVRTSALRELSVVFRQLLTRLPDIEVAGSSEPMTHVTPRRRRAPRSGQAACGPSP